VTAPSPGRRSAVSSRGTRLNATVVLAVVLPLACAAALALVRPFDAPSQSHPPTSTTLTSSTLVCPDALPGAPQVALSSAVDGVSGPVQVGLGKDSDEVQIASGEVSGVAAPKAVAVIGADQTAPGLVAARAGGEDPAATSCLPPSADRWFTGVGAGAGHTSVLELTNPDGGKALADITVLSGSGVVDAPRLRGVSVPGHHTVRLDLGQLVPRRGDLALHVLITRGRLGASVLDRFDRVGPSPLVRSWLPGQDEPAQDNLLLGLAPGPGGRTLVVANGGEDEVRATVKVVTPDSVFAPKGVPEIRVGPQSVARVALSAVLSQAIADGAVGIEVSASAPVTATLRSQVRGGLSATVGAPTTAEASMVLLSTGGKGDGSTAATVVVAGATRAGTVSVVSRAADGSELDTTTVEVVPERAATVKLPRGAASVSVQPARAGVVGAVLVTGGTGAVVRPLTVPVTEGLVPAVRPGLP
jgi:hypothetical protein